MNPDPSITRAAQAIRNADALLIGAGAGMGVDSGLPDFRGALGFWNAYPPYQKLGLHFADVANPRWFATDPALAWGFYGHRFQLYRATRPHEGFAILRRWADRMRHGAFVFTSNVDGHFQRAGFSEERVVECHGSINWLQCTNRSCVHGLWPVDASVTTLIDLDETTMRARSPYPACPGCAGLARPNILMFRDGRWNPGRTAEQEENLNNWLQDVAASLVIVELGAGKAIPTVRHLCEGLVLAAGATLVRINVRDPDVPGEEIGLAMGALQALRTMDQLLTTMSF